MTTCPYCRSREPDRESFERFGACCCCCDAANQLREDVPTELLPVHDRMVAENADRP